MTSGMSNFYNNARTSQAVKPDNSKDKEGQANDTANNNGAILKSALPVVPSDSELTDALELRSVPDVAPEKAFHGQLLGGCPNMAADATPDHTWEKRQTARAQVGLGAPQSPADVGAAFEKRRVIRDEENRHAKVITDNALKKLTSSGNKPSSA